VIVCEIGIWWFIHSCARECCPCCDVDDGRKSQEDVRAEKEAQERAQRDVQMQQKIAMKRAALHKKLELSGVVKEEDIV
jgi:hypothetical protein